MFKKYHVLIGGGMLVAYLDLILLLNWLFDCLLLYWTSILLKRKQNIVRIAIAGLGGALFVLISFTSFSYLANSILLKLAVSVAMVLIVFGFQRLKTFVKTCLTFYLVTFLTGGFLMGIHFLFSYQLVASPNTGLFYVTKSYGDPVSWLFIMIGFPCAWLYAKKVFDELESSVVLYKGIVDVVIKVRECSFECKGLIDTGNQLYEPITNNPVMILSISSQTDNVPADVLQLLRGPIKVEQLSDYMKSSWGERLRIIPYKVVGKEQQLMIAFRPDCIHISTDEKAGYVQKGIVAITLQTLSHDGTYECIVHPRMMVSLNNAS